MPSQGRQVRRDLGRIEEEPRAPVGGQDRLAERQGRADHIAAPDIEQPGDRGRSGDHRRPRALFGQIRRDPGALGGRVFAGVFQRMRPHRRGRLGWTLGPPGAVQGIDLQSPELGPRLGRRGAEAGQGLGTVQARVVAHHRARLQGFAQKGGDPAIQQVAELEKVAIDLVAHLQGVASVHEDGRLFLEDDGRSGRAGEARGPGQAVIGRRQVFVLVLVLVRNQEAVHGLLGHGGADQGHVPGSEGGVVGFVEGLAHARVVGHGRRSAKPSTREDEGGPGVAVDAPM